MFCPHCGTPQADDARFCAQCGMAVRTVTAASPNAPLASHLETGQPAGTSAAAPPPYPVLSPTLSYELQRQIATGLLDLYRPRIVGFLADKHQFLERLLDMAARDSRFRTALAYVVSTRDIIAFESVLDHPEHGLPLVMELWAEKNVADSHTPSTRPAAPGPPPSQWSPALRPPQTQLARGLGNGGIFVTWLLLGVFSLIFTWYSTRISPKAKLIWTGLVAAEVAVAIAIVVIVLNPATGGVNTSVVEQFVTNDVPTSVTSAAGAPSDETVDVQSVDCVQATGNTWTCDVTFNVSAPAENISQDYSATVNVTCDSTGTCSYSAFIPIPTG